MSIAVVDLLQELTDIDTLHESEEGAEVLIDALVSSKLHIILMTEQWILWTATLAMTVPYTMPAPWWSYLAQVYVQT